MNRPWLFDANSQNEHYLAYSTFREVRSATRSLRHPRFRESFAVGFRSSSCCGQSVLPNTHQPGWRGLPVRMDDEFEARTMAESSLVYSPGLIVCFGRHHGCDRFVVSWVLA